MSSDEKALAFLSICQRAGCISHGEFQCEKSIKSGKAKVLITALDASENTVKKFSDMASHKNIPQLRIGTRQELGKRIGKDLRSVITVNDRKMGLKISELINSSDER